MFAGWHTRQMSTAGALGHSMPKWTHLVQPWCWAPQQVAQSLGATIHGAGLVSQIMTYT